MGLHWAYIRQRNIAVRTVVGRKTITNTNYSLTLYDFVKIIV